MALPVRLEIGTFGTGGGIIQKIFGGGVPDDVKIRSLKSAAFIVGRRAVRNVTGRFLRRRTGRLANSIMGTAGVRRDGKDFVGFVGTNVFYGKAHEFGFHGTVEVKGHTRLQTMVFGRKMANPRRVNVFVHTVKMNLRERPWLRTALSEAQPESRDAFRREFDRWLKGRG